MAWNSVSGNGGDPDSAGIRVESSGNNLRGGTVSGNTGDGVQITGGTNVLKGATVQSNTGQRCLHQWNEQYDQEQQGEQERGRRLPDDGDGHREQVLEQCQQFIGSGWRKENIGPEYSFATPEVNNGSNKADNETISQRRSARRCSPWAGSASSPRASLVTDSSKSPGAPMVGAPGDRLVELDGRLPI